MRLPFSPIVAGTFLALLFLVVAYFILGGNPTQDDWGNVKTQNESKIENDAKKDADGKQANEDLVGKADANRSSKNPASQSNDQGNTFSINVTFDGGPFKTGQIVAGLFDNSTNFRNRKSPIQSCFLKVSGKNEYRWEFTDVPAGSYAISAYWDVNANSTLDKGAFGVPKEKYGFSNNARGQLGPPSFQACTFELGVDETLNILLK